MNKRLEGRIALVTGASRGIGAAVARAFAAEGAHVVAVARTTGALEELDDDVKRLGGSATLVPCDLLQHERIDQLGAALYERFGRLDVLVGAAGMLGALSPVGHIKPKDWEQVFALNAGANYRLIRSMDPLLRQSEAGRAIFVTDGVGRQPTAYWGPYAASKAALENLALTYAGELHQTRVRVNLIDPGPVATKLREKAFPGEDPAALRKPADVAAAFVELAVADCRRHGERIVLAA
ncbi:MAG TPA: SDR family NAD(P)-dependent oxidoreductase [Alphaproteobacteria bacterium]|nr:SDR family NAD(P)-dependent oxidoreductase [Alphaproteobacteria bacterium]